MYPFKMSSFITTFISSTKYFKSLILLIQSELLQTILQKAFIN